MSCCGERLAHLGHGVAGLGRAALSVGRVSDEVKRSRLDKCRACHHSEKRTLAGLVQVRKCAACDCFLGPKAGDCREACPIGLWSTEPCPEIVADLDKLEE
jgi:hypothetical protein